MNMTSLEQKGIQNRRKEEETGFVSLGKKHSLITIHIRSNYKI